MVTMACDQLLKTVCGPLVYHVVTGCSLLSAGFMHTDADWTSSTL